MAGTKSVPVRYSKGGVRADTRKLDQAQKATDARLDALTMVELWSWVIPSPEDGDIDFIINIPYAATINSITTDCTAGTATITGKINTTALGGTANSASTTEQEQEHSTANAMAVGDNFRITTSANSGCENLTITAKVTRAI